MFQSILVPLDGSPLAEKALPFAVDLAQKYSARLHLVRVAAPAMTVVGAGEVMMVTESPNNELDIAKTYLEATLRSLPAGLSATSDAAIGDAAEHILHEAKKQSCDLIVVTSHGRTGLKRVLIGSIAERLARHALCPVMIVGKDSVPQE